MYKEVSTVSNEEAAPETKGVTAELLTTVDLGPETADFAAQLAKICDGPPTFRNLDVTREEV